MASMKRNLGIWIDHKKAVIVSIAGDAEELHSIESGVEKHIHFSGGEPEDKQEHRFTNHLKEYYGKVGAFLHDADSILILGPGEAKGELEKHVTASLPGVRILGIETVDKMTDNQLAAKVRKHFFDLNEEIRQNKNGKIILKNSG